MNLHTPRSVNIWARVPMVTSGIEKIEGAAGAEVVKAGLPGGDDALWVVPAFEGCHGVGVGDEARGPGEGELLGVEMVERGEDFDAHGIGVEVWRCG